MSGTSTQNGWQDYWETGDINHIPHGPRILSALNAKADGIGGTLQDTTLIDGRVDGTDLSEGTVVQAGRATRTLADHLRDIVSVRDFPASGSDDTAMFAAAALSGSPVILVPAGTFTVSRRLQSGCLWILIGTVTGLGNLGSSWLQLSPGGIVCSAAFSFTNGATGTISLGNGNSLTVTDGIVTGLPQAGVNVDPAESDDRPAAIAGADAIMLTAFNEFDLDTQLQTDQNGGTFNGAYDQYVNGIGVSDCVPNFLHMVREDLVRLPDITTLMVWTQWFSPCETSDGKDPQAVVPAINEVIAGRLLTPSQWSVNGQNASAALQLKGRAGGSQNDASFIRGLRYLQSRGYQVGLAPIVLGWVNQENVPQSEALVWRGFFTFSSVQTCQTFMDSYATFVRYYVDLCAANGIVPARCAIGSEFADLTINAPAEQFAIFVSSLQKLASYVKSVFATCTVTYAANYTDYGVGGGFRLDALWSHPDIDEVGIDWYFPLTQGVTNSQAEIASGLTGGEDFDLVYDLPATGGQRQLSQSTGLGKTGLVPQAIDVASGIKNVIGFWQGAHFVTKRDDCIAEPTAMSGFGRDYDPRGLGIMTGQARTDVRTGLFAPGNSGQHLPPGDLDTYLVTDGSATYGVFTTPALTSGSTQTAWLLDLQFQLSEIPTANYGRVVECIGAFELMLDTDASGGFKLGLGPSANEFFITLGPLDTGVHRLEASVDLSAKTLKVIWDGVSTDYSLPEAATVPLVAGADVCVGGYNSNTNLVGAVFYQLGLSITHGGEVWGGRFHFDETWAGVRTAWTPALKPLAATELGFASLSGTCAEPSQFPYADLGSSMMALPAMLDARTQALYRSFAAHGWLPTEVYASWGARFNYDPLEQYHALQQSVGWMQQLRTRGIVTNITIYNLDARPAGAMRALSGGTIYYADAPLSVFSHALNGKLAGGSLLYQQRIAQNGTIL